jgi:protein-tyrosine phosphatase
MGFTDMVDLRSSEERAMAPTRIEGIRYTAVGYSLMALLGDRDMPSSPGQVGEIYRTFPQMFAPQVRLVFDTLLDATPGPIVYNCAAGQDRTGFTTAMVLMALGVPRETVIADYQLSTAYRRPEFEVPRLDPAAYPEKSVQGYFARMQQDPRMSKATPLVDTKQQPLLLNALEEIDRRWGSVDAYLAQEIGLDAADIAKLRQTYLE